MRNDRIEILLVEDDAFDSFVTQHYLRKGRLNYRLKVVHTGTEALDLLHSRGHYKNSRLPDLILVDVGLPDMDGREILEDLKEDGRLGKIPAIVLTGQRLEENPIQKFNLYEHTYLNKWVNMGEFLSLVKAVADFRTCVDMSHS